MNNNSMIFIGLDTHKDFDKVAYCEDERLSKPIHQGRIPHATLHFVYEAGPCSYWLYRFITSLRYCCYIVAPSLVPKKPGVKVKTDKRDALKLCQLLKKTTLTLSMCRSQTTKRYVIYPVSEKQLHIFSTFIDTFIRTHFKFSANPWPIFVDCTHQGIAV